MFLYYLINIWKKTIKENYIPLSFYGSIAHVYMENFHLTKVGSRQNQVRSYQGRLAHTSYEHILLKKFVKEVEVSPRWANPLNRSRSLPYE